MFVTDTYPSIQNLRVILFVLETLKKKFLIFFSKPKYMDILIPLYL